MNEVLRIGTRGSRLALIQTETVRDLLAAAFPDLHIEITVITTEGDMDRQSPLSQFGGRGAFVRSIETALLDNRIDIAVHSLKDLPSALPDGLVLGASPLREDPRDVLVSNAGGIMALSPGSVVGTGSERRASQLRLMRPDLVYRDIRGNIETRIKKHESGEYNAVVLAGAALRRMGFEHLIAETFEPESLLSAPCQGAIGVECREGDAKTLEYVSSIDNPAIRVCVDMERTFINTLGMGCHTPVGALAVLDGDGIRFRGYVWLSDTRPPLREDMRCPVEDADETAKTVARAFRKELDS